MVDKQKTIKITANSLPVSCPVKGTPSWDLHPRVYIELSSEKGSNCPYCGNHFILSND